MISIHHVWNSPLSRCLQVGSWCRCIWFESWDQDQFDQTTNQEQLCGVRETCLIVGLLPFIIILITASLSSNTYNKASWCADWKFQETKSMSFITSIQLWDFWRLWASITGFPDSSETRETFPRTETIRSHSSRAGNPSSLSPVSSEIISDSVELWETDVCFLAHPTYWNKCMTSQICTTFLQKWILNLQDLPQNQNPETVPICTCFSSISHMAILFVFTCVMNIWNQWIQAFVTSFSPFCYGTCELVYWP